MSHSIYSLIPKNYLKKSKSSVEFQDVENFIVELRKRIVDGWNYKFKVDDTVGSIYKIKFDQFEKKFLKKSDFVFFIVNSISEDAFKFCIDRLIKSCKNTESLENIIVISLSALYFEELNQTSIKFICFGEDMYQENANQWTILEDILKNKSTNHSREETPTTNTLPIPISNSGRKSPSKLKTFFHSLPAKFDSDKRLSLFVHKTHKEHIENTASSNQDVRLPNINISEIENEKNEEIKCPVSLREKSDSSKLSLNSLFFKKRPKKIRDSGLSLNSSVSTGSGSRKSDTMTNRESMSTDGKEILISSSDHSPVIHIAKVQKTEKHKAKIEIFKAKANKVIRSTNCLHSPKTKRSKHHVVDVMHNVVNFSSAIIAASSDIGNQSENTTRKGLSYLLNNRGKSEPPIGVLNNSNNNMESNGMIKYYSWNDISNDEKYHLKSNDLEVTASVVQPVLNENADENSDFESTNEMIEHDNINNILLTSDDLTNDVISDDEVFHTTLKPSKNVEIFDENQNVMNKIYTESSYSTFLPSPIKPINDSLDIKTDNDFLPESNSQKLSSRTIKLKDDPMESLDKLIKSIQTSCEEMRAARKSQEYNNSDEIIGESVKNDLLNSEDKICSIETNPIILNSEHLHVSDELILDNQNNMTESNEKVVENYIFKEETLPKFNFPIAKIGSHRELSPELIEAADSIATLYVSPIKLVHQTYQRMIRNPIIVSGIFAATTYTAPMWCSYIPRNVCLSKLFYGTLDYIFYSEVMQSIPNQILSTGRNTASVASKTIQRFLF